MQTPNQKGNWLRNFLWNHADPQGSKHVELLVCTTVVVTKMRHSAISVGIPTAQSTTRCFKQLWIRFGPWNWNLISEPQIVPSQYLAKLGGISLCSSCTPTLLAQTSQRGRWAPTGCIGCVEVPFEVRQPTHKKTSGFAERLSQRTLQELESFDLIRTK